MECTIHGVAKSHTRLSNSHFHHIFLIHSSIDGYLGCFRTLPIVNNAAMNMEIVISFSLDIYLEVGLLDQWQFFEETPYCFP